MDKLLIAGVESIAGSNLAAVFGQSVETTGLTARPGIRIEGCRILSAPSSSRPAIQQVIQSEQPDEMIFCGGAAQSCWQPAADTEVISDSSAVLWAQVASEYGCGFTFLSSDAVFTGPWMQHDETSDSFCESPQATRIRQIESYVQNAHPDSLIIRTHLFGWSADPQRPGFAECVTEELEQPGGPTFDCLRHASPLLATDLAAMLHQMLEAGLTGLLHLGGAERVSPFQFAETLATEAGLPQPPMPKQATLIEPVTGFGRGETSLDSSLARDRLGITLPLVSEGINRLLQQQRNGFTDRLRNGELTESRVA